MASSKYSYFNSTLGRLLIIADDEGLTGLYSETQIVQSRAVNGLDELETPDIVDAKRWLDSYFAGRVPDFTPRLHLVGTPFRQRVWRLLLEIPYGRTTTYGALAAKIAAEQGDMCKSSQHMSAQAVGGAVGHNPVSIIVPCHRVIGANGSLVGYAGGLEMKRALLEIEGILQKMPGSN